jgi:sugar phosphate isomerase/epimerase
MSEGQRDNQSEPALALVTEAFLDWPLSALLDWLLAEAPEIRAVEIGSGGYAPHPHCDREAMLGDAGVRSRWLRELTARGFAVAAFNAWGNPLHPDPDVASAHDRALRDTIRLASELGVDRVVAMAGCPAAVPGDRWPHFGAGGWLPYLEGVHERQWETSVAPYWQELGAFARAQRPDLLICLELHPGTVVYNAETFSALASLSPNLAANIDPSHFFWQHMSAFAVLDALAGPIGHAHAKDLAFNPDVLATEGLLHHRWPASSAEAPWSFATVGRGHDEVWWSEFVARLRSTDARALAIEHEDPDVPPEIGVVEAARLLGRARERSFASR